MEIISALMLESGYHSRGVMHANHKIHRLRSLVKPSFHRFLAMSIVQIFSQAKVDQATEKYLTDCALMSKRVNQSYIVPIEALTILRAVVLTDAKTGSDPGT